jgi:uncharacterized protein YdaU (DUF1376 family)
MPVRKMARPLHPGARVSLAYFPFYPADYEADTPHLTLEEDGVYNRLLRLCWLTPGCSLPDDRAWLMRRLRVDAETYDRVVAVVVAEFFKRRRGRIYSPRLSAIFEETSAAHNRRVKAGQKGGRPRKSLENNETGQSNAKAMPKQPEPEPEPKREDTSVSSLPRKRASRLSQDWALPLDWGEWAISEGWSEPVIRLEADKFRDYWISKSGRDGTKADWQATWRNWMRNSKSPKAQNGGGYVGTSKGTDRLRAFVGGAD